MGDGDDRVVGAGAVAHEVLGQPGHPLDVEVVGGLVEEQHVGSCTSSRARASRRRSPPDMPARRSRRTRRRPRRRCRPADRSGRRGCAGRRPRRARRGRRAPPRARWRSGSSASSWASTPTLDTPARVTRPVSTSRWPARTRSRVVLPPPLRPDDADPVAAEHPERDLVEHLGGAEGQGGALDTDEVGH